MLYAFVQRRDAQHLKEQLARLGLLAKGYPVIREGDAVGFPLARMSKQGELAAEIKELEARALPQLSREHAVLSRSFDLIGNVAIVRARRGFDRETAAQEAQLLMRANPAVKGVFARAGPIEGEYRVSPLVHLAGSSETLTVHKENGFSYFVDVEKVFFSPRLATERRRVYSQVRPGERVLDMFAGVGPFSIPMAKAGASVWACEINPYALQLLERNSSLNRVAIRSFPGDARAVAEGQARGWANRIVMNLPSRSLDFLDAALSALSASGGILHVYVRSNEDPSPKLSAIGRIAFGRLLKEVSSKERVYAADVIVKRAPRLKTHD
ncbi:class I SAM-dependent methyltransferase family protein [Tardisphaera miroshnichenkoae]